MLRRLKALFSYLLVAVLLIAGFMGVASWYAKQPLPIANAYTFEVVSGSNLKKVAHKLEREGIVKSAFFLELYARILGKTQIRIGEYRLIASDSLSSLLYKLNNGTVVEYSISFPEGLTYADWLQRLGNEKKLAQYSKLQLTELALPTSHPEGWFFPDTYKFSSSDSILDILRRAHEKMLKVLESEWQQRQLGLPYDTPYQALIMASIVEKETGVARERQQIAGVFVRRLQKRMKLQTDPTVIYGLGLRYKGNLTRKHLREDTPYNTYLHKGLPPTPIAMPGRAAIHAALNPADGETLYFVAKGDGTHYFSATLEEHLKAVREYQLKRNSDYRSAPPSNSGK